MAIINLRKGGWKNHREDTTDWNRRENAEKWRAAWAAYTNQAYLFIVSRNLLQGFAEFGHHLGTIGRFIP